MRTIVIFTLCAFILFGGFGGEALAACPPNYTTCSNGDCCSPDYPVCCWGDREGVCGVDLATCSLPGEDDDVDVGCGTGLGSHRRPFAWLLIVLPLFCLVVINRRYVCKRKSYLKTGD